MSSASGFRSVSSLPLLCKVVTLVDFILCLPQQRWNRNAVHSTWFFGTCLCRDPVGFPDCVSHPHILSLIMVEGVLVYTASLGMISDTVPPHPHQSCERIGIGIHSLIIFRYTLSGTSQPNERARYLPSASSLQPVAHREHTRTDGMGAGSVVHWDVQGPELLVI